MAREPHPFEQYPSEHPGWDRKHFDLQGRVWSLLVIDREDEQSSMISLVRDQHNAGPWPHWHHMVVAGLVTVDGAVTIIDAIFLAHKAGAKDGGELARREIRHALGIPQ